VISKAALPQQTPLFQAKCATVFRLASLFNPVLLKESSTLKNSSFKSYLVITSSGANVPRLKKANSDRKDSV